MVAEKKCKSAVLTQVERQTEACASAFQIICNSSKSECDSNSK